ncbi:hypothetical protein O181_063660 [Austropuccinia psidii MF-1]|uniref:Uncharacterized protein n=1 Tax=Austropuccinia psidii MF-1 TaxID=1389203 RepID=A0A9Q3I2E3_9BASI|nr:hypothetical protein [Austropuccinia psidii MF-1]
MTIVPKDGNIHKNVDGMSRCPLPNNIDNPDYVPEEAFPQIPIEGISLTDLTTTFFEEVRNTLGLAYKTSIHASTNQTPAILEIGWNPTLTQDPLRKDLVEINPTAASFKGMLDKTRNNSMRFMEDTFAYAKDKWDKSHATPDFKMGDLVLPSNTNFNNMKACKKIKDSFSGPFVIKALHG